MALSIEASPTIPQLNLGQLLPTPTLPLAGQIESIITSVFDGVTSLIPTLIPSPTPTVPSDVGDAVSNVAAAAPTPTPVADVGAVIGQLAQNALDSFPSMLLQNYASIESMASSIIAAAATETPTPVTFTTVENGKECTKTYTPTKPTFATTGVIDPLSIVLQALPNPTPVMQQVTSVIAGVTSVLDLPAVALPTNIIPLLGSMSLPEIDLPGLMGDKQDACIKDGNGNMVGLCDGGLVASDSETIGL